MKIRQSFCYPLYRPEGMDLPDLLKEAKAIGYNAVEFWHRNDETPHVVEAAKSVGLDVASMSGHMSLRDGLNKYENHDRIEAELRDAIDYAAEHGIPGLICFSGDRNHEPEYQSDHEGMIACARGLRRVCGHAEQKQVNLNVELLNSRVDHPLYQNDHTEWGLALCEMVDSPRVKLLYDIYHMQIMEGDLIRSIRKAIDRIGHFHTGGNPGRNDIDDSQEINYRAVCRAIAQTEYGGFLGHEFKPKADPLQALRVAFEICDQTG